MDYAGINNIRLMSGGLGVLTAVMFFLASKKEMAQSLCIGLGGLVYALALYIKSGMYPTTQESALIGAVVGSLGMIAMFISAGFGPRLFSTRPTLEDKMVQDFKGMGMKEEKIRKIHRNAAMDPFILMLFALQLLKGAMAGLVGAVLGSLITRIPLIAAITGASGVPPPNILTGNISTLPEHVVPALVTGGIAFAAFVLIGGFVIIMSKDAAGGCFANMVFMVAFLPLIVSAILVFVSSGTASSNLGDHELAIPVQIACALMSFIVAVMGFWMVVGRHR